MASMDYQAKTSFLRTLKVKEIAEIPAGDHQGEFVFIDEYEGMHGWAIFEDEAMECLVDSSEELTGELTLERVLRDLEAIL